MGKITIKDIAKHAGVSAMTVSYVLNKNPNHTISKETTQKVLNAVKELHYVPNTTAKALRSNYTYCIGVLLDHALNHQRYAPTIDGIRSTLEQKDYNILLCSSNRNSNDIPEYINCFLKHKIDGLIYIGRDGSSIPVSELKLITHHKIPVTTLDCKRSLPSISSVEFDYYHGSFSHVSFLLQNGANKILYIRPENDTLQERERESGLRDSLYLHPEIQLITEKVPNDLSSVASERSCKHISPEFLHYLQKLARKHCSALSENDVILCSWGLYVEPVYAEALFHNRTLQIASFAAGNLNVDSWPNLSYSMLPSFKAGSLSAELILDQISNSIIREERLETYIEHSPSSLAEN